MLKVLGGLRERLKSPNLAWDKPNDFLTRLFEQYNHQTEEEVRMVEAQKAAYETVMKKGQAIIKKIKDAETANKALEEMRQIEHVPNLPIKN